MSEVSKTYVGEGKVYLLSGGGKIFTDVAARFVRSNKDVPTICDSPYSAKIVQNILDAGHLAATEFDYFVFGVDGYSRVTEAQLIRKRLASYLIRSGRQEHEGGAAFEVTLPNKEMMEETTVCKVYDVCGFPTNIPLSGNLLLELTAQWYSSMKEDGYPEEDLRYMKPQATSFKAIIGMNAHSLLDWFSIRCCRNAQTEIRDMAYKMMRLCKDVAPDIFKNAGPSCKRLGYCPENQYMNAVCRRAGVYMPKDEALQVLREHTKK